MSLTPQEVVKQLDRFVIGQQDAKKAVAIALRNRWRRKQLNESIRDEIIPHNILMIGPTGVGKTEIARRLAKLVNAPFIKIEATKFTEVGYVGRDVDSIIRDLLDVAIKITRDAMRSEIASKALSAVESKILDILIGTDSSPENRQKWFDKLKSGKIDDFEIEIMVSDNSQTPSGNMFDIPGMNGQVGLLNISEMFTKAMGSKKTKTIRVTISEAYKLLLKDESDNLIDEDKVISQAIRATEEDGIVFLDEIDKIASYGSDRGSKGEVSREGVQRDLLPLVEGTIVSTKYGPIKTNHILFIASGAFHTAKPSDLLPELQGRFPIRVQLNSLTEDDLIHILRDTEHSITKQYQAMLGTEGIDIKFEDAGIKSIAKIAIEINHDIENIGARRLHTIMEKLLEELSFNAPDIDSTVVIIDDKYVENKLSHLARKQDLLKFLL